MVAISAGPEKTVTIAFLVAGSPQSSKILSSGRDIRVDVAPADGLYPAVPEKYRQGQ